MPLNVFALGIAVKQMSFIVMNPAVLDLDWQLVESGLVSYRNRIGMSFFCNGLVILNFFEENKHAFVMLVQYYFLCFSDTDSKVCQLNGAFKTDYMAHAL